MNFRKFGHDFGTRKARKSIKESKRSCYTIEFKKTLSHKLGSFGRFLGDDDVIRM